MMQLARAHTARRWWDRYPRPGSPHSQHNLNYCAILGNSYPSPIHARLSKAGGEGWTQSSQSKKDLRRGNRDSSPQHPKGTPTNRQA